MSSPIQVLLIGATGYIGGAVLLQILESTDSLEITVLVRNGDKAKTLAGLNLGVKIIEGSPSDAALLKDILASTDIIVDAYNSDDMAGTANILAGCKAKMEASGKRTKVIHISGVAIIRDQAMGGNIPHKAFDDANVQEMAGLDPAAPHRNVDLEFLKAEEQGYITSYIVIPGAVFGNLSNVLVDAMLQKANPGVFYITMMPVVYIGAVVNIGGGKNEWSIIHIDDCANLVKIIFTKLIRGEDVPHGPEGYFFAENGKIEMRRISEIAYKALKSSRGENIDSVVARPLTTAELEQFYPVPLVAYIPSLAANTVCTGTRGRALGWVPKKGLSDLENDISNMAVAMASAK